MPKPGSCLRGAIASVATTPVQFLSNSRGQTIASGGGHRDVLGHEDKFEKSGP